MNDLFIAMFQTVEGVGIIMFTLTYIFVFWFFGYCIRMLIGFLYNIKNSV